MIYAVIDTNVIIAAAKSHKPDSSTSRIIGLVNAGVIRPLVCREILEEYIQTLNLPILATYLVTNNIKHFPKRPLVVTPSEMLLILSEQEI